MWKVRMHAAAAAGAAATACRSYRWARAGAGCGDDSSQLRKPEQAGAPHAHGSRSSPSSRSNLVGGQEQALMAAGGGWQQKVAAACFPGSSPSTQPTCRTPASTSHPSKPRPYRTCSCTSAPAPPRCCAVQRKRGAAAREEGGDASGRQAGGRAGRRAGEVARWDAGWPWCRGQCARAWQACRSRCHSLTASTYLPAVDVENLGVHAGGAGVVLHCMAGVWGGGGPQAPHNSLCHRYRASTPSVLACRRPVYPLTVKREMAPASVESSTSSSSKLNR